MCKRIVSCGRGVEAVGSEAAGHIIFTIKEQRMTNASAPLNFFSDTVWDPSPGDGAPPFRTGLPTSINLTNIILHRHAMRLNNLSDVPAGLSPR